MQVQKITTICLIPSKNEEVSTTIRIVDVQFQ